MAAVARAPDVTGGRIELMNVTPRAIQDHHIAVDRTRRQISAASAAWSCTGLCHIHQARAELCKQKATIGHNGCRSLYTTAADKVGPKGDLCFFR